MHIVRIYASTSEAEAARQRLEQHPDSKATAEVLASASAENVARLEKAGQSGEELTSHIDHLRAGRALLLIDAGIGDMLRLNDLLGPNEPSEAKSWAPGEGNLEDEAGQPAPRRSEL